ncbi:CDP-alcohol phosphatidyltransferase family protein [Legionella israelensis]|uniref:CDP-alcohol phosphatidyltransferase family protein n=1 Tax=Legionella israelensis TaxID=454 RepID=A0AAX1EIH3_9GAMM|nr:CDP-alcohol phosphatidyltransferase family protein [Legionella israelensis]QBR84829.1 CDP-alcohol phosphatidyltransferase family protein [Legionella israelensis]
MIETFIRAPYQHMLVDPVAKWLIRSVSPNQLTLLSGFAGLLILPCLYFRAPILAIVLLLFSGYLDTLDGTLARLTEQSSDWGTVLDITVDRGVEFIIILSLWVVSPDARSFWVIMMLGSVLLCITSFLVVGIFTSNDSDKGFYYSPGIMERAEAFLFFIAMMLWPAYFSTLAFLFSFLVLLTAIIRLKQFYNVHLSKSKPVADQTIDRSWSHD